MKKLTLQQLKTYYGRGGRPAYVAYDGKVYDVTRSHHWSLGAHPGSHHAGRDLTDELMMAPHSAERLQRFPVVAELEGGKRAGRGGRPWRRVFAFLIKRHAHPVLVDFPIGLLLPVLLFQLLALTLGDPAFETTSYHLLLLGTASLLPAVFAGLLSWVLSYKRKSSPLFVRKLVFTAGLLVLSVGAALWRSADPEILLGGSVGSWLYVGLTAALHPLVYLLGFYGGKIAFEGQS